MKLFLTFTCTVALAGLFAVPLSVMIVQQSEKIADNIRAFNRIKPLCQGFIGAKKKTVGLIQSCGFLSVIFQDPVNRLRPDQPYANCPCLRNKYARARRV
jgi:hypothetical protein